MSILGKRVSTKVVTALVGAMVCAGGLIPVLTKSAPHEIVLVARDMAFHTESDERASNPVIEVKAGETIRVVLKNLDRGMTHDFAVPSVGASMAPVQWNEDDDITFEAPSTPGTYEYVCRPHSAMMKGTLHVTK
jgi:plastocyanin